LEESSAQLFNPSPLMLEPDMFSPSDDLVTLILTGCQAIRLSLDLNIESELCPADQLVPSNIRTVLSLSDELNTLILTG
jgi:hypothetical protein